LDIGFVAVNAAAEDHNMFDWLPFAKLGDPGLDRTDIAVLNFACAGGLHGIDKYVPGQCLRTLDEMARRVAGTTYQLTPRFNARPEEFNNSFAYFRALALITVLQRDCGIHYDQAKIPECVPFTPDDSFLFGVVHTKRGTCANIPVLYVAVGRRLGYPMKLVVAKGSGANHFFARWDDPQGERFNIEASAKGLRCPPDDYYRTGRYTITPELEQKGCFLKSLTPRQELAIFLGQRFHCWRDQRVYRRAVEAIAWASALEPANAFFLNTLKSALNEWKITLDDRQPKCFPKISVAPGRRRFPATLPVDLECYLLSLEAIENMLNDPEKEEQWWEPMRRRQPLVVAPAAAVAEFHSNGCRIRFRFTTLSANSYAETKRR
jgi:hypothetical protein